MKQYLRNASAAVSDLTRHGKAGRGSFAYSRNRAAIRRGKIPKKYTRVIDLVPGDRILELC